MATLPRDVHKWLQSLDLSFPVRNPRRDLSNGFLVAEIFSWYYPSDINMHSYNNGNSLPTKLGNWSLLQNLFKRRSLDVPEELVDSTIHCRPDGAELFVQYLYTKLTNRKIKRLALEHEIDFTDHSYQMKLPMHARSTASTSVKTNLKITEFSTEPNIITCQQKAQEIINRRIEHRQKERYEEPDRFKVQPTIGQRSDRNAASFTSQGNLYAGKGYTAGQSPTVIHIEDTRLNGAHAIGIKEISVNQMDHTSQPVIRQTITSSPVLPPIGGQS
ncbi:spermatogenesis-associated protein 4-like [Antedon mediterranea]|uniref:spermatogenesis-associated protein 4-like n=1 Tax=Antedon mediterranea TaxID=105859 RepID=UPI003AF9652F